MLHRILAGIILGGTAFLASGCLHPHLAPRAEGIGNFGRVTPTLSRGAQPDAAGLAHLQALGVRTIINLRMADDIWAPEEATARSLGMNYLNLPLPALRAPGDSAVAEVLAAIASSPPKVFIHCQHGADRTGTIIACYRMAHDGWTAEEALAEAEKFGFSPFEIGMRHYIRSFVPDRVRPAPPAPVSDGKTPAAAVP